MRSRSCWRRCTSARASARWRSRARSSALATAAAVGRAGASRSARPISATGSGSARSRMVRGRSSSATPTTSRRSTSSATRWRREGQRLDEAKQAARARAARSSRLSGEVADSLGWLYVKMASLEDAERLLVRADRMTPEDPEILSTSAICTSKSDRAHARRGVQAGAASTSPTSGRGTSSRKQLLQLETGKLAVGSGSR